MRAASLYKVHVVLPEGNRMFDVRNVSSWGNCPDNMRHIPDSMLYADISIGFEHHGTILVDSSCNVYYAESNRIISEESASDYAFNKLMALGKIVLSDYCKVDCNTVGEFIPSQDVIDVFPCVGLTSIARIGEVVWDSTRILDIRHYERVSVIDYEISLVKKFYEKGIMEKLAATYKSSQHHGS